MNRKLVASISLTFFLLAGCSRSCVSEAPHYGSYASAFAAPTWSPATYHARSTVQNRDEVRIDARRLGFVLDGQRVTLTDRTEFRIVPSAEKLQTFYPMPDDKGFLFVTAEEVARTFYAERFDAPMRLVGVGKPCHGVANVGALPLASCAQAGGHIVLRNDKAFPMTDDLVVLLDETGRPPRMHSLPSGEPPPASTPRADTLLTMDTGLAFLRGPDGLFARAPGETSWKRIGANTVTSLSSDESGTVIAYGGEGPTRIVEGTYTFEVSRRVPLGPSVIPATSSRAETPEGRLDRDAWTVSASHALGVNPDDCRIVGPLHDLLACATTNTFIMKATAENTERDRVYRVLSPHEELADAGTADPSITPSPFGAFGGVFPSEPPPILELEGIPGILKTLVSNEYGTLLQDMECNGTSKRFSVCARSPSVFSWKTVTLSGALASIAQDAKVTLFPAPNDEVFVFAVEPDGALIIGLGRAGRLRRFAKDEIPYSVGSVFARSENNGGALDAGANVPHLPHRYLSKSETEAERETTPQFLVTQGYRFRVVGIRNNGKSYALELGFDGQPDLDSFDGYVSFSGPYGLGLHDSGGLFESLDGGHSFVRVSSPPLPGTKRAEAGNDAGATDLSRVLRCHPAGCNVGGFERRGYGVAPPNAARDAGRDGR